MKDYPHFSRHELRCKCGCDGDMDDTFMAIMERIRADIGPLKVSSAYRCPDYNEKVSHTGRAGPHTTGRAIDILISGEKAFHLIDSALEYGMTGIGISQKGPHASRFVHLDNLEGETRPWVWSY